MASKVTEKKNTSSKLKKKIKKFVIHKSFMSQRFPKTSFNLEDLLSSEVCFRFPVQTDIKFKAKLRAAKF